MRLFLSNRQKITRNCFGSNNSGFLLPTFGSRKARIWQQNSKKKTAIIIFAVLLFLLFFLFLQFCSVFAPFAVFAIFAVFTIFTKIFLKIGKYHPIMITIIFFLCFPEIDISPIFTVLLYFCFFCFFYYFYAIKNSKNSKDSKNSNC